MVRLIRRAATSLDALRGLARDVFGPLPFGGGYRPTSKRSFNLYLNRIEHRLGRPRLWSLPLKLVVEPVNACNLRCPYCFTGAGRRGRAPSAMSLELYRRVLDELGDCLFEVEAFNWGEPLLSPHLETMIADASARGIATKVNTNLSLPFDEARAERLIDAGLTNLTVSIDGARQATYEQYRVRGDLERVLANCRRVAEVKRRRGSHFPHLNWEFHVFPHNTADYPRVKSLASELGMNLFTFKGAVPGADWDVRGDWHFCVEPRAMPCASLWAIAVVNNDGGVAPCNGTFHREDDMGSLSLGAGELGARTFRAIWNGPRYVAARRFFRRREGSAREREQVCFDCPQTIGWERRRLHLEGGGHPDTFEIGFTTGDAWNYFWNRRSKSTGNSPGSGMR